MGDISFKGYHGTCSWEEQSIESKGLDPQATKYRKDHWLGQGVYFFENIEQAKWWAAMQSEKRSSSWSIIYQADILADKSQVLNLDNNDELEDFLNVIRRNLELINLLAKDKKEGYPIFTPSKFSSVFFDYYKEKYGIKIIIYSFIKDYVRYTANFPIDKNDISIQKALCNTLGIYFKEKQLCVSDKACIRNRKKVYDGREAEII